MDLCWQSNVSAFYMLSRLVIAFLPRGKHLLMSWLHYLHDFGTPQNKVWHCLHCFSIYFPWSDGTGCHDLRFLTVELSVNFFSLFFHFHQEALQFFFTFCHKSGVTCVIWGYWYFSWQSCASSSLIFLIMYSAYKLNKKGDNIQPWHTPFPIWNQSVVPCPVLTVASWPAYRFLRRQVRWSGIPISQNFPQFVVIHTIKGFGIVNKADFFLELSSLFDDPTKVGNLISGSSAFSKSSLNIWKFTVHILLNWRILSITLLACEMSAIV